MGGLTERAVGAFPVQRDSDGRIRVPVDKSGEVGYLMWDKNGLINSAKVNAGHQRQGVATAMLAWAQDRNPNMTFRHNHTLTDDGRAWAASTDIAVQSLQEVRAQLDDRPLPPVDAPAEPETPGVPEPAARVNLRSYQRAILGQYRWESTHPDPAVRSAAEKMKWYEPVTASEVRALSDAINRHTLVNGDALPARRTAALTRMVNQLGVQDEAFTARRNLRAGVGTLNAGKAQVGQRILLPGGHGRSALDVEVVAVRSVHGGRAVEVSYRRTPDAGPGEGSIESRTSAPVESRILMRTTPVAPFEGPQRDKPADSALPDDLTVGDRIIGTDGPIDVQAVITDEGNPGLRTIVGVNPLTGESVTFDHGTKAPLTVLTRAQDATVEDAPAPHVTDEVTGYDIQVGDLVAFPGYGPFPKTYGEVVSKTGGLGFGDDAQFMVAVTNDNGMVVQYLTSLRDGETAVRFPTLPDPVPVLDPADVIDQPGATEIGWPEIEPGDRIQAVNGPEGHTVVGIVTILTPEGDFGMTVRYIEEGTGEARRLILSEADTVTLLSRGGAAEGERVLNEARLSSERKDVARQFARINSDVWHAADRARLAGDTPQMWADRLETNRGKVLANARSSVGRALLNSFDNGDVSLADQAITRDQLDPLVEQITAQRLDEIIAAARRFDMTMVEGVRTDSNPDGDVRGEAVRQIRQAMSTVTYDTDAAIIDAIAQANIGLGNARRKDITLPGVSAVDDAGIAVGDLLRADVNTVLDAVAAGMEPGNAHVSYRIRQVTLPTPDTAPFLTAVAFGNDPKYLTGLDAKATALIETVRTSALAAVAEHVNAGETEADAIALVRAAMTKKSPTGYNDPLVGRGKILAQQGSTALTSATRREVATPDLPDTVPADPAERVAYWRGALPQDPARIGKRTYRSYTLDVNASELAAGMVPTVRESTDAYNDINPDDDLVGENALRHLHAVTEIGHAVAAMVEAESVRVREEIQPDLDRALAARNATNSALTNAQASISGDREAAYSAHVVATGMTPYEGETAIRSAEHQRRLASQGLAGVMSVVGGEISDERYAELKAARNRYRDVIDRLNLDVVFPAEAAHAQAMRHHAELHARYQAADAEATRRALAGLIHLGPASPESTPTYDKTERHEGVKLLRWSEQHYPTEWLTALRSRGKIAVEQAGRGSASHDGRTVALEYGRRKSDARSSQVAIHEMGHLMEGAVPGLVALERAFLHKRTSEGDIGERTRSGKNALAKLRKLKPGGRYKADEETRQDKFPEAYSGKAYGGPGGGAEAYELFTTGIESLFAGSDYLAGDPEYRAWILGTLVALTTPKEA
jgi:hypothetical protein